VSSAKVGALASSAAAELEPPVPVGARGTRAARSELICAWTVCTNREQLRNASWSVRSRSGAAEPWLPFTNVGFGCCILPMIRADRHRRSWPRSWVRMPRDRVRRDGDCSA